MGHFTAQKMPQPHLFALKDQPTAGILSSVDHQIEILSHLSCETSLLKTKILFSFSVTLKTQKKWWSKPIKFYFLNIIPLGQNL